MTPHVPRQSISDRHAAGAALERHRSGLAAAGKVRPGPLDAEHFDLVQRIIRLTPPPVVGLMDADDYENLHDHLRNIAEAFDLYCVAIGSLAAMHSPHTFDRSVFKSPAADAIDGNALYELKSAADRLRNDAAHTEAMRRDPSYARLARALGED